MCLRARGGRSSTTRWSSASVSRTSTHSSAYCASLASPISSMCCSLSSIALLWLGTGPPQRMPLPGEGRRLERNWFGRIQVFDVRGDVNTPAVSLQEPPEVRKVQELHAENAARPVGVEIHAGGQLHRARRPALGDLAPEVDVQGVRFFVVFESHNLFCAPFLTVRAARPTRCEPLPLWLQCT